jgi:hypothetical protein
MYIYIGSHLDLNSVPVVIWAHDVVALFYIGYIRVDLTKVVITMAALLLQSSRNKSKKSSVRHKA